MKYTLAILLYVSTMATNQASAAHGEGVTPGVLSDTLITGCELILFGREVPAIASRRENKTRTSGSRIQPSRSESTSAPALQ